MGIKQERQSKTSGGYVAVMTALLLVPLMIFAAFAVDVGAWYSQAAQVQTAADAASLAGVPHMPDRDAAQAAALSEAARNGFVDGEDGVAITFDFPDARSVVATVEVDADTYFANVVMADSFRITRSARAEYVLPIPMGSPTNVLGFGPNDGPLQGGEMTPANYWLLEGGPCQPAHDGDVAAAKYNYRHGSPKTWCGDYGPARSNWKQGSEGRDGGYFYVVDIPAEFTKTTTLWIFDPGVCPADPDRSKPNEDAPTAEGGGSPLGWRVWSSMGTPLIPSDDVIDESISPGGTYWTSDECSVDVTDDGGWTETNLVFPPNAGANPVRYYVQTKAYSEVADNWSFYGYWLRPNGSTAACSTLVTDKCPTIAAERWIPARASGAAKGIPMDLYLAEIEPVHKGKTLNVVMWDPGEGMDNIQILDPNGVPLNFTWTTDDLNYFLGDNPADNCSGIPCLDLRPDNNKFPGKLAGWPKRWKFNGRTVTVSVPLDSQVDFDSYPNYWFSLRFVPLPTRKAQEWASFSLNVTGDPIRLTD